MGKNHASQYANFGSLHIIKAFNNMFHIFLVFVNKLNYYT